MGLKKWHPPYPMIVVSPQCHADTSWNPQEVHKFISYLISNYPINSSRIYLTGTSMGGYGVYRYLTTLGAESYVAAAIPIMGGGSISSAANITSPVWAFHGGKDQTVSPSNDAKMIEAIKTASPTLDAKITMFTNLGHEWNTWFYTFSYEGWKTELVQDGRTDVDSNYAPYDQDIYSWMLQFRK